MCQIMVLVPRSTGYYCHRINFSYDHYRDDRHHQFVTLVCGLQWMVCRNKEKVVNLSLTPGLPIENILSKSFILPS